MKFGQWVLAKTESIIATFKDTGGLRLGHPFSEGLIEQVSRRDAVAYFWTSGVTERSFRDGFTIVDSKGDPVPWITAFEQENYLDEIIKGVSYERKWGSVTFALFEAKDKVDLLAFRKDHSEFKVDDKGHFTEFKLSEHIGGQHQPIPHTVEGSLLTNVFHEVLRPDKYKYQGSSVLEPIWDLIDAGRLLLQCMTILTARTSSGIRKATVEMRDDKSDDDDAVDAMELGLGNLEADDVSIILRSGANAEGVKWEDQFDVVGGPDFDFEKKMNVVHSRLAIATGVPKNYFDGIFQGSLMGAETILQMLHTALKKIQDDWTYRLENIIERWCEIKGNKWLPDYHIKWNLRPLLTEIENSQIEQLNAQSDATLYGAGLATLQELRKLRGRDETVVITKPSDVKISVDGLDNKAKQDNEEEE